MSKGNLIMAQGLGIFTNIYFPNGGRERVDYSLARKLQANRGGVATCLQRSDTGVLLKVSQVITLLFSDICKKKGNLLYKRELFSSVKKSQIMQSYFISVDGLF